MIILDCFSVSFHYFVFSLSPSFSLRATLRKILRCPSFVSPLVLKLGILNTSL